jgi:hypothetical protein
MRLIPGARDRDDVVEEGRQGSADDRADEIDPERGELAGDDHRAQRTRRVGGAAAQRSGDEHSDGQRGVLWT